MIKSLISGWMVKWNQKKLDLNKKEIKSDTKSLKKDSKQSHHSNNDLTEEEKLILFKKVGIKTIRIFYLSLWSKKLYRSS